MEDKEIVQLEDKVVLFCTRCGKKVPVLTPFRYSGDLCLDCSNKCLERPQTFPRYKK